MQEEVGLVRGPFHREIKYVRITIILMLKKRESMKSSTTLVDELCLTSIEVDTARALFKVLDKYDYGFIQSQDLVLYLSQCGHPINKYQLIEMLDQCGCSTTGVIHFSTFLNILGIHKRKIQKHRKDSTLDAFLSVGGSLNEGSSVDTNELINIVKNEFEMTIDLQSMVKEIDVDRSGKIDFQEFCALFNN